MTKIGNWDEINLRGKNSGVIKTTCPTCSASRKKTKDPCLYVNITDGVAKCYNCEILYFRDDLRNSHNREKKYTLPSQDWQNYTKLSDNLVKYFEGRGIQQHILTEFNIGEEVVYHPQLEKEANSVVFNYFEGDLLVNKKYRSSQKTFTQTKGGKPIMFNINSVIGKEEVYIVEGEICALSFAQIGIRNVISLPNGANDNDAFWVNSEKYLKHVKKFYIATDNDEKGNEVAEKIAQRLGRYRCERLMYENKDANDDLVAGVLTSSVLNTKRYPVSGTYNAEDLFDQILELRSKGIPETIKPKGEWFSEFNKIFSVMRGHLVVGTGIPSHGKSSFTEWYALNLVRDYNMKLSLFSPEHSPMELHFMNICSKVLGKNSFKAEQYELEAFRDWSKEKIYLTSPEAGQEPNWEWLLETFESQMFTYGIDMFIIDAWNKVILNDRNELQGIRRVLTKLTAFAQQNNVIIFLVAHPTKQKKLEGGGYEIPDLYSVSGSADFRNQTHDGFAVHRDFVNDITEVHNCKTKYSFQGEIGKFAEFKYDIPSGRYYGVDSYLPAFSFTSPHGETTKQVDLPMPMMTQEEAFNIDDELPF